MSLHCLSWEWLTGCDMPGGTAPPHPPLLCPPSPKSHSWLSSASASPQLPRPPGNAGLCFSSFLHLRAAPGAVPGARQCQQSNTLCVLQRRSPSPACFGPGTQGLTPELNSSRRVKSKLLSEAEAPWPCAAAQLLLKVLSHPSSDLGLPAGLSFASLSFLNRQPGPARARGEARSLIFGIAVPRERE